MTELPVTTVVSSVEAVALSFPLHHVEWPEDERPKFTCTAEVGAKCRLVCAVGCDAESWPCGPSEDDDDKPIPRHPMQDSGECHVVLFLDNDEWCERDRYSGPIRLEWDYDHYDWEPAK